MSGGNVQNLVIHPGEVNADGTYSNQNTLTGPQAGGFGVTGTVTWNNVYTSPLPTLAAAGTPSPGNSSGATPEDKEKAARRKAELESAWNTYENRLRAERMAGSKVEDAFQAGLPTANQETVKAWEQARKGAEEAEAKRSGAFDTWRLAPNAANKQASDDTRKAWQEASNKEQAARQAVINSMAPEKVAAVHKAQAALEKVYK